MYDECFPAAQTNSYNMFVYNCIQLYTFAQHIGLEVWTNSKNNVPESFSSKYHFTYKNSF